MRNWSHITSVCACSCWRCPCNVSQSITVSTTRLHTHTHTHSLIILSHPLFSKEKPAHIWTDTEVEFLTLQCVCVCVYVYRLFQNQAYAQHTHNLSTQKPEHTQWICSLSTAACFIAPVETSPSSTFLFNMQGINCLHDKLQPSQLRPCDIYTRVVYKHRCGNIISGFVWRMSRESSVLFALMNHAVTSFHTSSNTFGICAEWASARTSCLIMVMWLFTYVTWSLWHVFGIYMKANISAV